MNTVTLPPKAETVQTRTSPVQETRPSIQDRNLRYLVERISKEKAPQTIEMLQRDFPTIADYTQLRALATAYIDNDCRPLRRVEIPSQVDPETLSGELSGRFHDGFLYLRDEEVLIVKGNELRGPFDRAHAPTVAKRMGAESPTNDAAGHILDPEASRPTPALVID